MAFRVERASGLDLAALTTLFNAGYAGYIVPVNVNQDYVEAHIRQQAIALDHSPVVWDGDQPVGFAFLAIRGAGGWVGALGVASDYRKQGVGRLLMQALLDNARAAGLRRVQLEVIVGNDAAHALYLRSGLHDVRRVLVLERAAAPVAPAAWPGTLEAAPVEVALAAFDSLHISENPWQRRPESIRSAVTPLEARVARRDGGIVATVTGSFSAERLSLIDVGTDPAQPDALAALLTALHAEYPQAVGRLVNLAEDDPARPVLEALGYHAPLSQNEMHIDL
jgi:GNAT superfamily N-acetyltransferase